MSMTSFQEAFKHLRRLHIQTTKAVDTLFAGIYHSAFKGQGIQFEEVREYQEGDEIRYIDWNVTARMQHPYIKTFREERELTVMLVVDISGSTGFGSGPRSKSEIIAEIGAILAFSAIKNQDKVGLLLFSDEVELYLKPKKGTRHVLRIIRELLFFKPKHHKTSIQTALSFLGTVQSHKTICFLISDFIDQGLEHDVSLLAQRHDLIAIHIQDEHEKQFPPLGLLHLKDLETEAVQHIDTSFQPIQQSFASKSKDQIDAFEQLMIKVGADFILIDCEKPYLDPLRQFFKRRGLRR